MSTLADFVESTANKEDSEEDFLWFSILTWAGKLVLISRPAADTCWFAVPPAEVRLVVTDDKVGLN